MIVTVEISYYPLAENYNSAISEFINRLCNNDKIKVVPGKMSSLISGKFQDVMQEISHSMEITMEIYPSVFNLKISNSCPV